MVRAGRHMISPYLDALTAGGVMALLGGDADAGGAPLFEPGIAHRLHTMCDASMAIWEWDVDTNIARMRHEMGAVA